MKYFNLLMILVLAGNLSATPIPQTQPSPSPEVKIIQKDQVLDIEINGQLFTTYHFADDFIRPYVRPFFWPVRASDGTDVSIDQAQHKELHPHQRGMWIGHGDVNGADEWKITTKPIQPKERHVKFDSVTSDSFQEELIWEDKLGQPMLNEVRTVKFVAYPDGSRGVDVTLKLSPVKDDVVFADDKDCGLFSIRMIPSVAGKPLLLNSTGVTGDDCDLKHADWCDESGQIDGKIYGAAILDDPHNPRHPPLWHAHTDARLSPDIFSLHKADKVQYPNKGDGNFTIKSGDSATFRYRAIIHTGDGADAQLAAKYAEFVSQK